MIIILSRHVMRNIWVPALKVKVTAWPLQQDCVQPITSLFEVESQNYFTEIIIILRLRNLLPVSKSYSGSITQFDRLLFNGGGSSAFFLYV